MDDPMIFLEMLILAKVGKFGYDHVSILKPYMEYVVSGNFYTYINDLRNDLGRVIFFPGFFYDVCACDHNSKILNDDDYLQK
jgi:hypothetical protein